MSDVTSTRGPATRRADGGFTLIELLVAIVLTGVLTTALASAITVIVRQQATIAGRLNNARSENGVGFWVPADLASADSAVDTNPLSSACFGTCPTNANVGGSNAFLVTWTSLVPNAGGTASVTRSTRVSYRYALVGNEYQLIRVECDQQEGVVTCSTAVVLHRLSGPPDGSTFVAGSAVPDTIIKVTAPYVPGTSNAATTTSKNGQRVIVSVNGGGSSAGVGGGTQQISLSASGTDRSTIDPASTQGAPTFVAVRSRCGGALTLVIDESASIAASDFAQVKTAVQTFVSMFAGTPIKMTIIPFDTYASVLGATGWTTQYNMLNQTDVDALLALVNTGLQSFTGPLNVNNRGGTNWEDALYRTFYAADGTVAQNLPGTVVFFTDGVPTFDRLAYKTSTAAATPPAALPGYPTSNGSSFNQQAFYRANLIAAAFRDSTRMIGVGVGTSIDDPQTWIDSVPGYHYSYSHSYHYEPVNRYYHIEKGFGVATMARGYHIEVKSGSTWATDPSATSSTALNSTHRVRFTAPFSFFRTVTGSANATADQATSWTSYESPAVTNLSKWQTQNVAANVSTDGTDGWTDTRTYTGQAYWEIKTDATAATAPQSGSNPVLRVKFTAPYSFAKAVTPTANPTTDGATAWTTVTTTTTNQALFNTQDNGGDTTDSSDGWTSTKVYTSPFTLADTDTVGSGYNSNDPAWSRTKQYSQPYTAYDASSAVTESVTSDKILSRLISDSDTGVRATTDGQVPANYTNPLTANMYILPQWDQFAGALKAIALSQCGGTLTLQTRVGTVAAADPFTYQRSAITSSTGAVLPTDNGQVTTTKSSTSGTFDFTVADGTYVTVDIQPSNFANLTGYTAGVWSCTAGGVTRTFTPLPITGTSWTGIRVKVGANEAVSCIQTVSR
ncbi:MAG: hypothetical protein JWM34_5234 [Ilumatobacteraceae bacterium]|nr:hypothetical protein [Ilumatobacteraceae bacterium]